MEKQEKKTMKKNTGWNKFFIILTMIFTLDYLIWRISIIQTCFSIISMPLTTFRMSRITFIK